MSKVAAALIHFLLIFLSCLMNYKFPEGWFWTKIIPVAPSSSTFFIASRTSTTVWDIPLLLRQLLSTNPFERFKYKIRNSSWGERAKIGNIILNTFTLLVNWTSSFEGVSTCLSESSMAALFSRPLLVLSLCNPLFYLWMTFGILKDCFHIGTSCAESIGQDFLLDYHFKLKLQVALH